MKNSILIKSASIIDVNSSHHNQIRDVLIVDGYIVDIGQSVSNKESIVIEAKGSILSMGWCDMRSWFADPGMEQKEDLESGRSVALDGGFTHVAVLPNNNPITQNKNDVKYLTNNNKNYITQIHPIAAITKNIEGKEINELIDLFHSGAIAFSEGHRAIKDPNMLCHVLMYLQKFDGLLIDQPNEISMSRFGQMNEGKSATILGMKGIPQLAEEIIVQRNLAILEYAGGRLHFSCLSSPKSLEMIKTAKKQLNVSCDIASYQLLLDDTMLHDFDTNLKLFPPLRSIETNKQLLKYLADHTIDTIVSNHWPQEIENKKLEFNRAHFGMISLQTVGSDLCKLREYLDWEGLIKKVTTIPRNLLNIKNHPIEIGNQADLTLFDPKKHWILDDENNKSKSKNSPYYGQSLVGKTKAVFNNGKYYISNT